MTGKGADLFPVAKGVNLPFVGKEEGVDPCSGFTLHGSEKQKIHTGGAKQSVGFEEEKWRQLKQPKTFNLKDKSRGKIDKKYLKLISSGLSFDNDVIEERAKGATGLYSSNEENHIFDKLKKAKKRSPGLSGKSNVRRGIVRHFPCFLNKKPLHTIEKMEDMQLKPLPQIQSKATAEIELARSTRLQEVAVTKPQITWDEYLMNLLSRETAEMVIKDYTSGVQQKKLNDYLVKGDVKMLEKNSNKECKVEKDQADIKALKNSSQPNGTGVVKKNKYSKQINNGAFPIANLKGRTNNIILDSDPNSVYGKVLETSYPPPTDKWYDWDSRSKKHADKPKQKVIKGMHKWKDYPEFLEDTYAQKMTLSDAPVTQSSNEIDSKTAKRQREDINLVRIVQEWRGRWFLEKKWENSSNEELLHGMSDINDHVRLSAVSACSKALLDKKEMANKFKARGVKKMSGDLDSNSRKEEAKILEKIQDLLSDRCKEVQVASAITLFALNRGTEKAKDILLETLRSGGPPEKWAASQCLAFAGCDADVVVKELFNSINTPDVIKHSRAMSLLTRLSKQSTTVQYTLAEQLNSSSWRDRVVACQIIPSLQGPLSTDIASKISHLMWNDWSKDVRTAAARALGRTGNGKLVHDKLRERLNSGNEIEKIDALRKISFLGIMTGRMLPAFLACLRSDYVSIRLEAAIAVSAISLSHEEVVNELLRLAKEERSWKVKAHCIKAIGLVAKPTENVQEILLWCLRYESEAAIRAEACRAIRNLKMDSERVLNILQDRIDAEEDDIVQREVVSTLTQFGVEPTGDFAMVKTVHEEVKKLCNRRDIADAIVNQDVEKELEKNKRKFLIFDDEEASLKGTSNNKQRPLRKMAHGDIQMNFDPVYEGYILRRQSKVSVPSLPNIPEPAIDFDLRNSEYDIGHSDTSTDD